MLTRLCAAAIAAGALFGGCAGSAPAPPGSTVDAPSAPPSAGPDGSSITGPSASPSTATDPGATPDPAPAASGPIAAAHAEGAGPTFSWDPVPGAAEYEVTVVAADGAEVPWIWVGTDTTVSFGDVSPEMFGLDPAEPSVAELLATSIRQPRAGATYTWMILAYDAEARLLTGSAVETFECLAPCGG